MTKTFEDLQLGDILIAKKSSKILTANEEYTAIESTGYYISVIDDEGHQLICNKSGIDSLFAIKESHA
jgi:hypothetical protein